VNDTGNYLVVGAGLAGLSFALRASKMNRVTVLSKSDLMNSNSSKAQGGIAAVQRLPDSFDKHTGDTLHVGQGLGDRRAVELMVRYGPGEIQWLMDLGVDFSFHGGELDLTREGGHSARRVVHAGDITGHSVQEALIDNAVKNPRIRLHENVTAIDLIVEDGRCVGLLALNEGNELVEFRADTTALCTGGSGQLYSKTSNPVVATCDGVAMAFRAGVVMRDMEFIQFHPSILDHGSSPFFLISEAVRGEGGVLVNSEGERFMLRYHPLHDLAPRDVVSRAIVEEQKKGPVYIDIRDMGEKYLTLRFPGIYKECLERGFRMDTDLIPVSPAAHYMCGGIKVNEYGETSVTGLLAFGETSCSGVHGANRLASNSTLECMTFPHIAVEGIVESSEDFPSEKVNRQIAPGLSTVSMRAQLQEIMWTNYGIIRKMGAMREAELLIRVINERTGYNLCQSMTRETIEDRNLSNVALLVARAAQIRRESRGTHKLEEYPFRDDENWLKHIEFKENDVTLADHV